MNNFHNKPFEEHTLTKLRLYKAYVKAWLPVFMSNSDSVSEIHLYDLFCGPGCDCNGESGSPLILLEELNMYLHCETTKNHPRINILFNDEQQKIIDKLKELISIKFNVKDKLFISFSSKKYAEIFPFVAIDAARKDTACFVFIDQYGINAISDNYIKKLSTFPRTDWLAFVAASQARRFMELESIKFKLKEKGEWRDAHRTVADTCREIISNDQYYIVPFSIKHKSNIHGLVFGSGHPLGAEKFINACWNEDKNAGEANFDIDGIIQNPSTMLRLFSKKIDAFESELYSQIQSGTIYDTLGAYKFALNSGVKSSHARNALHNMKSKGLIKAAPPLSYSTTIQKKRNEKIFLTK